MSFNEKHKKVKREERSQFSNFLLSNLKESMVTGIPGIVSADSILKKLIRAAVFIASMSGFIYQSHKFMDIYWKYETIVDVKVTTGVDTDLPAFTICNYNGLQASEICRDDRFRDRCSEQLKRKNESDLGYNPFAIYNYDDEKVKFPDQKLYKEMSFWEFKDYEIFLQNIDEFMLGCSIVFTEEGQSHECKDNYERINCPPEGFPTVSACFTINTIIGKPEEKPLNNSGAPTLTLMIVLFDNEYPDFLKPVRTQFSIHNSRQVLNPFDEGFTLLKKAHEIYQLKKIIKNRLPYPYDTNCVDYIALWKSRGGYGPTNKKECMYECQKNASLKEYGCISQVYYRIPGNERRCDTDKIIKPEMSKEINECAIKYCGPACYEETFEAQRDSGINIELFGCSTREPAMPTIQITIQMAEIEVTTYTYRPKYDSIEIFSYIGGYIGMWLGISLMGVFDFFELLFLVLMYPFKNYMATKKKMTPIQKICIKYPK